MTRKGVGKIVSMVTIRFAGMAIRISRAALKEWLEEILELAYFCEHLRGSGRFPGSHVLGVGLRFGGED